MISKGRTGTSFGGLHAYLLRGREADRAAEVEAGLQDYLLGTPKEAAEDRVAWAAVRNLVLDDPEHAAVVMDATASQNARVQKPVYHVSLSAAPGEHLDRDQWERIADRLLQRLKLEEHQVLMVAHRDKAHEHLHLMINRVHMETLKAWDNGHDYARRERALRHIEREFGLREVPGRHYQLPDQERPGRTLGATAGERSERERTGAATWADGIRDRLREPMKTAKSWAEVEARLKEHGLFLKKRGRGLMVTDGERMVKASRVHRGSSYAKLAERFGSSFEEYRKELKALVDLAQSVERVEKLGFEVERRKHGYVNAVVRANKSLRSEIPRINREIHNTLSYAAYQLRQAYRPAHARKAKRKLWELGKTQGWDVAARAVAAEPERFGRLKGYAAVGFGTEKRLDALVWTQRASESLGTVPRKIAERDRVEKMRPAMEQLRAKNQARAKVANRILGSLTPRHVLREQLGRLALRLGGKAVASLLPKPLAITVKGAVRMVEIAREAGRGMGR